MNPLRQSTARTLTIGPCVSTSDGFTAVTTLATAMDDGTTGIRISKNGAALAARHATVTATSHDADGYYKVVLDTTDSDTLGKLFWKFSNAAIIPIWGENHVVTAGAFDAFMAASGGNVPTVPTAGTMTLVNTATALTNPQTAGTMTLVTTATSLTNPQTAGTMTLVATATTLANPQTAGTMTLVNTTTALTTPQTAGTMTLVNTATNVLQFNSTAVASALVTFINAQTQGTLTLVNTATTLTNAQTAGTMTLVATATNLTNAPTVGDFTAAMKTSINAAAMTAGTMTLVQSVNTVSTFYWSGLLNGTASNALTGTTISSNQSISQATLVLTTQSMNTMNWAGILNASASTLLSGTVIKSDQTFTAVNSITNSVTVSVDNATTTRNANVLLINGTEAVAELTTLINAQTGGTVTSALAIADGAIKAATFAASASSQTFGLVVAYDAAKTAATQASVNSTLTAAQNASTNTTNLPSMISGSGTTAAYTVVALANAPSGGGGGAPTASANAAATAAVLATAHGAGSWEGGIVVVPITATVSGGTVVSEDIVTYQNATQTFVFTIVDGSGDPYDLSGKTVRFTASLESDMNNPVIVHDTTLGGGVTIAGSDHNQAVVVIDDTDTRVTAFYRYAIWNVTDDEPVANGAMTVLPISQEVT